MKDEILSINCRMQNNRRGRGGRIAPGMRPVDETTRIDIGKIISDFQAGNDEGMHKCIVTS